MRPCPQRENAAPIWVDRSLLDCLAAEASSTPRRRKNFNFHHSDEDACHRLLNAVEPDTYIQPHRHLGDGKDETVVVVRGRLGVLIFDDTGAVIQHRVLAPGTEAVGIHVPRGTWHTWVVLEPASVFLEAKAGPYRPFTPEERASWAPPEGTLEASGYLGALKMWFGAELGEKA